MFATERVENALVSDMLVDPMAKPLVFVNNAGSVVRSNPVGNE